MDLQQLIDQAWSLVQTFGFNLIVALVIFVVGRWVARIVSNTAAKLMNKRAVDVTLISFVRNLVYVGLLVVVVLAALSHMGIETTSFVAIIGAAGLAIGLALQGSLSNFAAGILMIIFRPFKVGDIIEAAGTRGTVQEIQIFTTKLHTPDSKTVIIPNAKLTSDIITNFSTTGKRRVDLVFGIGYDDDIDQAKEILNALATEHPKVHKEPAPVVAVLEQGDSSINICVRPWVNTADYWEVYFYMMESVKKQFDAADIGIPFPQRDVHLYQHTTNSE